MLTVCGTSSGTACGLRGPLPQRSEINAEHIDPLYLAAVEATGEAVINALVAGEDTPTFKPQGKICRAIDTARLRDLFRDG